MDNFTDYFVHNHSLEGGNEDIKLLETYMYSLMEGKVNVGPTLDRQTNLQMVKLANFLLVEYLIWLEFFSILDKEGLKKWCALLKRNLASLKEK